MGTKLFFLSLITLFISCGTTKTTTKMDKVTKENLSQILNQDIAYKQLKISGNVKANINGSSLPGVKLTIYNEKGKEIWINGQVALMSAGRALATPEKFQAYEKLQKTYVDENYDFINDLLGVNFIDYEALEKLLLGKVFVPINLDRSDIKIDDRAIVIIPKDPIEVSLKGKKYSYSSHLEFDSQLNLTKVEVEDEKNDRTLTINYDERENYDSINLPKVVKIDIKDKKPKTITLNYNSFDDKPMEVNFKIPSGYTKREIK